MIKTGSLSGRFDMRVYDARTGQLTKERSFPNLITNRGLIGYCSGSPSFYTSKICVGNGTATPAPEDTTLANFLAESASNIGSGTFNGGYTNPVAPDYISSVKGTARFNAGTFDGTTITEVGVTNTQATHPVWCRALILDEQGAPSSLTILANEYLDVTYTLFYHPDLTDAEFQFAMDGVTYNCTARAANVGNSVFSNTGGASPLLRYSMIINTVYNTQTLGEVTGVPIFSSGGAINIALPQSQNNIAYSSETPYTHAARQTLGLAQGNFDGGIGAMLVGFSSYFDGGIKSQTQISFSPKLPKDANTEMTFTLAKTIARWQDAT